MTAATDLVAVVVDDEQPALDELAFLLGRDQRIGTVHTCSSATDALRLLHDTPVDVVFLDIQMPGLTGLEMAQVLHRFRTPPQIVFVTAHDAHAVEAFDLGTADYVLKPVREERLAEAVRRVVERVSRSSRGPAEQIPVERGGVTRFVSRDDIRYVEAHGDYARLHTDSGSHLVRTPISTLEEEWRDSGFVRVHRSLLVSLRHVDELRTEGSRCSVVVGGDVLQVSRRHTPHLREVLTRGDRG